MSARACPREAELLASLRSGAWPAGCEEELRGHAAGCPQCRDLVEVAAALLEDRHASLEETPLPGSGLVWWKLQMRLRDDRARAARRTLLLSQALSVSIAGGLALGMLQLFAPSWAATLAGALPVTVRGSAPLLFGVLACLAVAGVPIAAYCASRKS